MSAENGGGNIDGGIIRG